MNDLVITAEDLLAGANGSFDLEIPSEIMNPAGGNMQEGKGPIAVRIKPLTIGSFQLIMKAAKNEPALIPLLMIKESVVHPALTINQVKQLHIGLVDYLMRHIRQISGLAEKKN